MNYRGSYRHLLKNSKAALLAAIEIYNKPRIEDPVDSLAQISLDELRRYPPRDDRRSIRARTHGSAGALRSRLPEPVVAHTKG